MSCMHWRGRLGGGRYDIGRRADGAHRANVPQALASVLEAGDATTLRRSRILADFAHKEALIYASTLRREECRCPKDDGYRSCRRSRMAVDQRLSNTQAVPHALCDLLLQPGRSGRRLAEGKGRCSDGQARRRDAGARSQRQAGPGGAADEYHDGDDGARGPRDVGARRSFRRDEGTAARLLHARLRIARGSDRGGAELQRRGRALEIRPVRFCEPGSGVR